MSAVSLDSPRILPVLDRTALVAALLTPLLLMHAHGIAEVAIGVTDLCFLARCAMLRDWAWTRAAWFWVSLLWWGWLTLCSLPIPALGLGEGGTHSLIQAIATVRFPLYIAALGVSVLRDSAARRWLFGIIVACVVYIAAQTVIQVIFGRNLYGDKPAWGDIMTGPFSKARAGPPLSRIILPALLPLAAALLARRRAAATAGAYALLLGGMCVLVLIGQRMPLALGLFGLVIAAFLLPRMRPMILTAGVLAIVFLGTLSVVFPPTFNRLIYHTQQQVTNFASVQYGELYARALEIGRQNPITGLGYDGFGTGCPQPKYFRPSFDGRKPDGGGAKICWVHPHNYYFQALTDGGVVGLVLFTAMGIAWLIPLGRGLWRQPDPMRVALFAVAASHFWPLQSTSAFTSMPMGGWFFLLLGWGMAEALHRVPPR